MKKRILITALTVLLIAAALFAVDRFTRKTPDDATLSRFSAAFERLCSEPAVHYSVTNWMNDDPIPLSEEIIWYDQDSSFSHFLGSTLETRELFYQGQGYRWEDDKPSWQESDWIYLEKFNFWEQSEWTPANWLRHRDGSWEITFFHDKGNDNCIGLRYASDYTFYLDSSDRITSIRSYTAEYGSYAIDPENIRQTITSVHDFHSYDADAIESKIEEVYATIPADLKN